MKVYSNEIVFRGHPDKVCDQISDAILDECLRQDKNSRCGIETVGGKGKIFITGEVSTNAHIDVEKIAKSVLADVYHKKTGSCISVSVCFLYMYLSQKTIQYHSCHYDQNSH